MLHYSNVEITRRGLWTECAFRRWDLLKRIVDRVYVPALRSLEDEWGQSVRSDVEISIRGLCTECTCRRWDLQQGIVDRDYVPAFDFYQLVLSARVWNCVGGLLLIRHKADICRKYFRCHKTGFIHQTVIFCYIKSIQMQ